MMRRREFIALLSGASAWPLTARAQQPALPVVGFVNGGLADASAGLLAAFRQGLKEAGYIEGQNVTVEYRWAEGRYDRLTELAAELVHRQLTVILAGGGSPLAAKAATATIPIVFVMGEGDPVEFGLVASFNRPGGNITGITSIASQLSPKRLELLHQFVPTASVVAMLANPKSLDTVIQEREVMVAARLLGLELRVAEAATESDLAAAFATIVQMRADALLVSNDAFFGSRREYIADLAARHALPAIFSHRDYAVAGGLMSYGASLDDAFRLAGTYVGRILKGEKPADLPVGRPTKFEFVINLKTAKALGLDVPPKMLALSDEVIE